MYPELIIVSHQFFKSFQVFKIIKLYSSKWHSIKKIAEKNLQMNMNKGVSIKRFNHKRKSLNKKLLAKKNL